MKKRLQHNHFRMNIVKSLRTPISKNIIWECLILQQDNRLFQEKSKQGGVGGGGWGYGICRGYQRDSMWNFRRLIKNEVEFPRVTKKKCGISSRGLCFWPWHKLGSNTILWNIQELSFVLSDVSRGKLKKWKLPGGFSKKYILNPPCLDFSGIAQFTIRSWNRF